MKIKIYNTLILLCLLSVNPIYGRYYNTSKVNRGHIYHVMKTLDYLFNKHQITYWVDGGIIIGTYRHGSLVPWDLDIDLEIKEEDLETFLSLKDEFSMFGMEIHCVSVGALYRVMFFYMEHDIRRDATLEVYPTYLDGDVRRLCFSKLTGEYKNSFWTRDELSEIVRKDCGPIVINMAIGAKSYAERYYGANVWRETDLNRGVNPHRAARYIWPTVDHLLKKEIVPEFYFTEDGEEPEQLKMSE